MDGIQRNLNGHLVVSAALQKTACLRFLPPAPLLEEERDSRLGTLKLQALHPIITHRPCTVAALPTHDYPMNSFQIEYS